MYSLSFVIPCLNEEKSLLQQQANLKKIIESGHEIIVVDGGSHDKSRKIVRDVGCTCISTKTSRGFQLHTGAKKSTNEILIFLHADSILSNDAIQALQNMRPINSKIWGRFNVSFTNNSFAFKIIAWFMNQRSCMTAIVTGDHTLFVCRKLYFESGGYEDIPIMEDIQISKKLKRYSRPICLKDIVTTSSRKWERDGIIKTIFLMWRLRLYYFLGVSTSRLAKMYYKA